jgi:PAS domain S-box-containing protein
MKGGGSALLRRQITLITILVAAVALVLVSVNISQLTRALISRTREQAEVVALQAATAVEAALVHAPDQLPQRAISDSQATRDFAEAVVRRGAPITSLLIEDRNGTALLHAPKDAETRQLPTLESLSRASFPTRLKRIISDDRSLYEYTRVLEYQNNELGRVRLGITLQGLRGEVLQSLIINLLIALAAVAAATFIAISSARLITAPLRAITSTIEQIERGGSRPTPDEEKHQSANIDDVADRIEQISRQVAGDRSELRETRGRLQQILSTLQERLLMVNADGRVMLASPGVETMLGAQGVVEGRSLVEIVGPHHQLVNLTKRALASREKAAPVTVSSLNGGSQPFAVSIQPITDRGETVGALITLHDRETLAKLESQLNYSERLADFARITSGIAHEVKNPLNAMVIHLELLRSKLERIAPAGDDARPQLDIITSEIQRLDRVVQTFLDFTRPPRVSLRPLDVNQILEETLALAAPEAEARGAKVERSFDTSLPRIAGDADLLKQAFLNIVINGLQAMESDGNLQVSTTRDTERTVLISIRDHGSGIPLEARDRIFQLYYTTKPEGHGIGLAQAFRAVQLHNGQITFESAPDGGTTFHLRIPTA